MLIRGIWIDPFAGVTAWLEREGERDMAQSLARNDHAQLLESVIREFTNAPGGALVAPPELRERIMQQVRIDAANVRQIDAPVVVITPVPPSPDAASPCTDDSAKIAPE